MQIVETRQELEALCRTLPRPLALVPTMGALHQGHLSLVSEARNHGAKSVLVSIFVNPTQFMAGEDFANYPRQREADLAKLKAAQLDGVWLPSVETIYPIGFDSFIEVGRLGKILEGEFRPLHFRGVATVVARLFGLVQPDIAVFGEKDYQQLAVIKQVVRDFAMAVRVIGAPICRNGQGLALSSRNSYLSDGELVEVAALHRILQGLVAELDANRLREFDNCLAAIEAARLAIMAAGFQRLDYLVWCLEDGLQQVTRLEDRQKPSRILVAAIWLAKNGKIESGRIGSGRIESGRIEYGKVENGSLKNGREVRLLDNLRVGDSNNK